MLKLCRQNIRKFIVLLINITIVGYILYLLFFATQSPFIALFILIGVFFLILFDAYAVLLMSLFNKENEKNIPAVEFFFYVLLMLPFFLLFKLFN